MSLIALRKRSLTVETVFHEGGPPPAKPLRIAAACAVIRNPYAGRYEPDLLPFMAELRSLGTSLAEELVATLGKDKVEAYSKAAIVGVNGDLEHAAAVLHPKLGKPMRAAIGGGEAIIPSVTKVAAAGAFIDVPLANKDNPWSFDELDSITVALSDAPRPNEILVVMAIGTGGRPNPRVGKGRAIT